MENRYSKNFLIEKIKEYSDELGIKKCSDEELNKKTYEELLELADSLLELLMK